ncbi:hypothetical protein M758_3G250700, partial [Ceratodon purpureus]
PQVGVPHNERPVSEDDNQPSISQFHTNLRLISLASFSGMIVPQIRSSSFLANWDATKETKQVVHIASLVSPSGWVGQGRQACGRGSCGTATPSLWQVNKQLGFNPGRWFRKSHTAASEVGKA